ncbi:DMT family transporter [Lysinibacillus sp. BPa_S21]|uniref:DMT family transporter n=1 Tax=Lysinibacillus sp. BPa_S21 TaxID=2932478 RepID=UPI0020129BCC|nr:DMT family transporter [Lysinibacillus sp. BPa_S21]MCL1694552.1 DMT family transporter [Lysinibacillus sp. BPa_S21]
MEITKKRATTVGLVALVLSALLTAMSQVFYAKQVQEVPTFLFTGISFFMTAIYFSFFARKHKQANMWRGNIHYVVKLNVASVLAFMGFYFALKYVESAIVSALEMGIGPLFVLVLAVFAKESIPKSQWVIATGTFIACTILIFAVVSGKSAIQMEINLQVVLALIASVGCGIGAVLCTIYSKRLSEAGWTTSMILANRYYGIILLSFFATFDIFFKYFQGNISWIIAVTAMGVMLPMYLLQIGIQYCSPLIVMMSLCFVPIFAFFFQLFDARLSWSPVSLIGISLLFILGVCSLYLEKRTVSE